MEEIFEYAKTNVTSTIFICWGAQAALHYYYGIEKHKLDRKLFGVYKHKTLVPYERVQTTGSICLTHGIQPFMKKI